MSTQSIFSLVRPNMSLGKTYKDIILQTCPFSKLLIFRFSMQFSISLYFSFFVLYLFYFHLSLFPSFLLSFLLSFFVSLKNASALLRHITFTCCFVSQTFKCFSFSVAVSFLEKVSHQLSCRRILMLVLSFCSFFRTRNTQRRRIIPS